MSDHVRRILVCKNNLTVNNFTFKPLGFYWRLEKNLFKIKNNLLKLKNKNVISKGENTIFN